MLQLLFERDTHRLRGVHIVGASASDRIPVGQSVPSFGGPVDYFVDTVFDYPTLSEAYRVTTMDGLERLEATVDLCGLTGRQASCILRFA